MARTEKIRCKNCKEPIELSLQKNGRLKCPACDTIHKLRPEHIRPRWKALNPRLLMLIGGGLLVILVLVIILSVTSCSGGKPAETTEAVTTTEEILAVDTEWEDCLLWAQDYLSRDPFSYLGLMDQLIFDGYSQDAARYAVDNCGADWYAMAEQEARSLVELGGFDRMTLIETLMMEGYSESEAGGAADAVELFD